MSQQKLKATATFGPPKPCPFRFKEFGDDGWQHGMVWQDNGAHYMLAGVQGSCTGRQQGELKFVDPIRDMISDGVLQNLEAFEWLTNDLNCPDWVGNRQQ